MREICLGVSTIPPPLYWLNRGRNMQNICNVDLTFYLPRHRHQCNLIIRIIICFNIKLLKTFSPYWISDLVHLSFMHKTWCAYVFILWSLTIEQQLKGLKGNNSCIVFLQLLLTIPDCIVEGRCVFDGVPLP